MLCSSSTTSILLISIPPLLRVSAAVLGKRVNRFLADREPDDELRPFARRTVNGDRALMVLDDPVDDRQSQTRAPGLCCKKGIEYPVTIFLRDSLTRILYDDL